MLKDYLESALGSALCAELGWSADNHNFDFIVSETLDILDLTDEPSSVTKSMKAVGKIELFKAVLKELSTDIDISADGASLKRTGSYDMVSKLYRDAYTDGIVYMPEYQITIGGFDAETTNPYSSVPYYERD
jgi:hypothetical protein